MNIFQGLPKGLLDECHHAAGFLWRATMVLTVYTFCQWMIRDAITLWGDYCARAGPANFSENRGDKDSETSYLACLIAVSEIPQSPRCNKV